MCNEYKSQRVTARIRGQDQRLFDPRHDSWPEHFAFMNNYLFIAGISLVGLATEQILNLNGGGLSGPLGTRHDGIMDGYYPPEWARGWTI